MAMVMRINVLSVLSLQEGKRGTCTQWYRPTFSGGEWESQFRSSIQPRALLRLEIVKQKGAEKAMMGFRGGRDSLKMSPCELD